MRLKAEAIFEFGTDGDRRPNKIVRQYRDEYKALSEILDKHSEILEMAHRDLAKLSQATSRRGRKADFTSENLFRAVLVMQREGLDYREASVRIAESETLQNFCRLIKKRLRKVRRDTKTLIVRVEEVLEKAEQFVSGAKESACLELVAVAAELARYLPAMRQVANVARRRAFHNEQVPNRDKVFSIFEPHAELIKRGRRSRPIEFGHKVLLTQSKEKFITDFVVLEHNRTDDTLLPMVLDRHEEKYGQRPKSVAADKGFCPDAETYEELEERVDYLGMPRRTSDLGDELMRVWQHWRAGIEGSISCLKRVFRLARCCFRGFKNFASAVGSAVFCHNLTILARTTSG